MNGEHNGAMTIQGYYSSYNLQKNYKNFSASFKLKLAISRIKA